MNTLGRGIATVVVVAAYSAANILYSPEASVLSGDAAGHQFDNADGSYVHSIYAVHFLSGVSGLITLALLVALALIWYQPLVGALRRRSSFHLWFAAVALGLLWQPLTAKAYYDKTDFTEAYTILPNESAFWIPDVGANKDSQAQLETEAFLNANKVSLKRFIVPHVKLQGSGSFFDFYVPAGRLIIVDRTPFSREWVDSPQRGTSNRQEGFPCQSKEGLNITVGVALGASVSEENAAKYLYHFGVVAPKGDRKDPQVIFTSVYYSRGVRDVMDDFGRKKVSEIICDQISARSFDKVNEEAKLIKDTAAKQIADYFATFGITIDFMGWADTFTFDPEVQNAVNRRYIASQDKEIAAALQPFTATIQALAAADALRAFGQKTDGKLPTTLVGFPPELGNLLKTLLQSSGSAGGGAASLPTGAAPGAGQSR